MVENLSMTIGGSEWEKRATVCVQLTGGRCRWCWGGSQRATEDGRPYVNVIAKL
ncbi:MAG: hypothetical protein FWG68_09465 [Defluviitaleaceae bacterium]|nr:hypothetical protein [Defluviitaleaceae bacterium]